jgi:Zn-dependent protease with chaperone function
MNFFADQDRARRNTRRLVVLFVLAVVAIVVAVYLAVVVVFAINDVRLGGGLFLPELFVPIAGATLLVIGGGSAFKTLQLSDGGSAVGRLLGGRPLDPNTRDLTERRVLNVVEEMAIAAGTPVPEVYLLDDERSINAFAAGRTPSDAVIGITKGTAALLSRDELQGVVAHEVSHVLNGDMRLNLRLMGVVHGILVISLIGYWMLRSGSWGGSRRGKSKGGGLALLGIAFYLIGWIGVFFGRLIKAAVSRQREYLADAAAVQFTRNPLGIGGALRKIGGYGAGSKIGHRRAEEASHLFFADGLKSHLLRATSTHPPLDDRIRRIDPSWDGEYPKVEWPEPPSAAPTSPPGPRGRARDDAFSDIPVVGPVIGPVIGTATAGGVLLDPTTAPEALTATVGTLDPAHVEHAAGLLAALPDGLREAAREPAAARALVFALLLDPERAVRVRQLEALREKAEPTDPVVVVETRRLAAVLADAPPASHIPLLDLALPALRRMSAGQYQVFRELTEALAHADGRISLFEYALHRMLLRHLDPRFGRPRETRTQYYALNRLGTEISCLLALLARSGAPDEGAAFDAGVRELREGLGPKGVPADLAPPPREKCGLDRLDHALAGLSLAAPRLKEQVLQAAVATVIHDHEVTASEGELLRAIADTLDCPVPPFLRAAS